MRPGYSYIITDSLLTVFHLPDTSLIYPVTVTAGEELIRKAHNKAVSERFRFSVPETLC
ncbi:MAG: S-adenosylmethionine:tRNA ribosyltransferase-isomerase [Deltaproteobacteria bacterium]|nr:S-adenosylmethionine:tRNA ribosyltransferase-isomerase [Deltaproteobacteria bacterium]